jgi:hypothetical protein
MSGICLPATLGPLARVAADDQGRWSMNGVQVTDPGDGTFCCVGTDGRYLLVVRGIQVGDERGHLGCPPDRSVNVPAVAWTEAFRKMPKLLDPSSWSKKPPMVQVALEGQKVRLSGHERSFTCDEIDGRFPDWKQVLPKKPPSFSIAVDPEKLAELLKTVQGMIGESKKVTLAFWKDNEPMAVVARNPDNGLCLDGILMPLTPSPSEMAKEKEKKAIEEEEQRENDEGEPYYRCTNSEYSGPTGGTGEPPVGSTACDWHGYEHELETNSNDELICPKCGYEDFEEITPPETPKEEETIQCT